MHFLNGNRVIIIPENVEEPFSEQLAACRLGLSGRKSRETIYKLNVFVKLRPNDDYEVLRERIGEKVRSEAGDNIILNVIAQAPFEGELIMEAHTFDPDKWHMEKVPAGQGTALLFKRDKTEFLLGSVQSFAPENTGARSELAFSTIKEMLDTAGFSFSSIVRQWNYIEGIIDRDHAGQNYQDFNDVRSRFYGDAFSGNGYPAATGIGTAKGGVLIDFIAAKSGELRSSPIDNPRQVPAHGYSEHVLVGETAEKTTPKFERARYMACFSNEMVFISGTAAITGETSIGIDRPEQQTRVTIDNMEKLYCESTVQGILSPCSAAGLSHARVYVRNSDHYPVVREVCLERMGRDIPMIFVQADICRDDLLVEIEAEALVSGTP